MLTLRKNDFNDKDTKYSLTNVSIVQERIQFKIDIRKDSLNKALFCKRFNLTHLNLFSNPHYFINSLNSKELIINGLEYILLSIFDSNNSPYNSYTFQTDFVEGIHSLINSYLNDEDIIFSILKTFVNLINENSTFSKDIFFANNKYIINYLNIFATYNKVNICITCILLYFFGLCCDNHIQNEQILYNNGIITQIIHNFDITNDNIDIIDIKIWFISILNTYDIIQMDIYLCIELQKKLFDIIRNNSLEKIKGRYKYIIQNCLKFLMNLSSCSHKEIMNKFIKSEIINYILLYRKKYLLESVEYFLRIVGNLISEANENVNFIINENLISYLLSILKDKEISNKIKDICFWVLGNIIAEIDEDNWCLTEKIFCLFIELIKEGIKQMNFIFDNEIIINLGAMIGNMNEDQRMKIIQTYDMCTVINNFIMKYVENIQSISHVKVCYYGLEIIAEIVMNKNNSGVLGRKLLNEKGCFDLIEKIINLSYLYINNVHNNEMLSKYYNSIITIGEELIKENKSIIP